jgi:hypothetical protein
MGFKPLDMSIPTQVDTFHLAYQETVAQEIETSVLASNYSIISRMSAPGFSTTSTHQAR